MGNKPTNTFKHSSFVRVAKLVAEKFKCECEPKHVENRLKTIKAIWTTITKLQNKSGFGLDYNLKMVTCSTENYNEKIMAHPSHDKYLNKKIEMYDEMSLVVGKDMATGAFAKSFSDVDLETSIGTSSAQDIDDNEFEEVTKSKEASLTGQSSKARSHRKRARDESDPSFELIAGKLGDMADAIKELSDEKIST